MTDDAFTDDEFEKLLDNLHGTNGVPSASAASEDGGESDNANLSLDAMHELILDPSMTIAQVGELHERMCSLLNDTRSISIKAADVKVIDTANFQLLFAFIRDRAEKDLPTELVNPSDTFNKAAAGLGLAAFFSSVSAHIVAE